jgi:protocatechuate 3,4-dioxygenase beta subunit
MFHRFFMAVAGVVAMTVSISADDLLVKGVVTDSAGKAVSGATVVVLANAGSALDSVKTNASGQYSLSTEIESSGSRGAMIMITASAVGAGEGFAVAFVESPGDGTPDTIEQDIELGDAGGWDPGDTTDPAEEGDSLYVGGKVTDEDGNAVEGAVVTIQAGRIGGGGGSGGTIATTNSSGQYSASLVNTRAGETVSINVLAAGFEAAQEEADIDDPADGKADVVVQDIELVAMAMDTFVVTATVLDKADDSPLKGARVIIGQSEWSGSTASGDTGITNSSGVASFTITVAQGGLGMGDEFGWTVEMDGYASAQGTASPAKDTIKIGTVKLEEYSQGDEISYSISGNVTSSGSGRIGEAEVIVVMEQGGSVIFRDTVNTSGFLGGYSTSTSLEYDDAEIKVTVSVTADGYNPASATKTFESSTSEIVIDLELVPEGSAISYNRINSFNMQSYEGVVSLFSINGRYIGNLKGNEVAVRNALRTSGYASQPVVLLWKDIGVRKVIMPAR